MPDRRPLYRSGGMSVRTRVARRGASKWRPNPLIAITPAVAPSADVAARPISHSKPSAAANDGIRQAPSHQRVSSKIPAEIQPTSGGFVATPSFGVCW